MSTTYHLSSAEEISTDFIDAIKATFKSKPITIVIEEDEVPLVTDEMKLILDERLAEDEKEYISAKNSISKLKEKYGV